MSNEEVDSGESGGANNVKPLSLLDDTLTRKLPSMTFEKYIKQTNGEVSKSAAELSAQFQNCEEAEEFELNLDGGSPALNKFQNPFEDTPNDKNGGINIDFDEKSDPENNIMFKTPSKREPSVGRVTPASLKRSKLLNLWQASSNNAADEFRALKNNQVRNNGFDFETIEDPDVGLVIDIRRNESEVGEETSVDDSGIQLNLIPTTVRFNRKEETQNSVEQTQADGNVHEEVNQMIRHQISNKVNDENGDAYEDRDYLLEGFNNSQQNKYSSNDVDLEKDTNVETSNEDQIQLSSAEKGDDKYVKDTLDITRSSFKNTDDSSSPKATIISSNTPPKTPPEGRKVTQEVEGELDGLAISNSDYADQVHEERPFSFRPDHDKALFLKETQVIDNFSQSIVIDDDEDEEPRRVKALHRQDGDDEDGEEIKTGRNILNTFKIEDESQSQSQLHSQSQLQLQSHSNPQLEKPHNQPNFVSQDNDADQIQIQGSQANSSFGIPDTQVLTIPETLKIEVESNSNPSAGAELSHISSPTGEELEIDASKTENEVENEVTDPEIPNTSAVSISKICLEVEEDAKRDTNEGSGATSTPIITRKRVYDASRRNEDTGSPTANIPSDVTSNNRSNMMERLSNVLREEDQSRESLLRAQPFAIVREKTEKTYDITDVLDCNCVFIMDSSSRIPGRITKVVHSDDVILVNVEVRDGEVIVDHSKIYAPICFCVGDSVKYAMDKRQNYVVTGLKRTGFSNEGEDDQHGRIETIDGYNKILIKKNKKNTKEVFEEIEVDLKDLYLTAPISRNYKYKLFNDTDDFQKYIDYQISRSAMIDSGKGKYADVGGADDTLINLLPVSRNRSFVKSKNHGYFSKCLFVITGLNSVRNGSRGDSKSNTPRHQRDKSDIHHLVDFIRLQGGTVLQDSGFEELVKFKLKERKKMKKGSIGHGLNTSPRKAKKSGSDANGSDTKKGEKEFRNFDCLVDSDGYYVADFREGKSVEVDEEAGRFEFGCVISTRHVRTLKYLQCLCLKWPIIHTEFIKDCMIHERTLHNWENEWTKYLLISGECSFLNSSIGLDIFEFYGNWKRGYRLSEQVRLNRLFEGSDVVIVADNFNTFEGKFGYDIDNDNDNGATGRKRRKGVREYSGDNSDDSDVASQSSSVSDAEKPRRVIDGPADEETLLWIFRQLGFDRALILKEGCDLKSLFGSHDDDDGDDDRESTADRSTRYVYFKYGNDIERFRGLLDKKGGARSRRSDSSVNWEWVVQRIICNVL